MFNKNILYTVHIDRKPNKRHNFYHDEWEGCACEIISLETGRRGWLLYKDKDRTMFSGEDCYGLMHLSTVISVKEYNNQVQIETKNSYYTLTKIE